MRQCLNPVCGNANPPFARFCGHCGQPVVGNLPHPNPSPGRVGGRGWLYIGILIAAAAFSMLTEEFLPLLLAFVTVVVLSFAPRRPRPHQQLNGPRD